MSNGYMKKILLGAIIFSLTFLWVFPVAAKSISKPVSRGKKVLTIQKPPKSLHKNVVRDDTFLQFFSRQSKKRQQCMRRLFSKTQLSRWFSDPDTTLSLKDIRKVSQCVGYYIEY